MFIGAMGLIGGSNFIFPRFYRHTFVMAVDSFDDTTLNRIFTSICDWHFSKGYPEKIAILSRVSILTISIYIYVFYYAIYYIYK